MPEGKQLTAEELQAAAQGLNGTAPAAEAPAGARDLGPMRMLDTVGFGIAVDLEGKVVVQINLGADGVIGARFDTADADKFAEHLVNAGKAARYFQRTGKFEGFDPNAPEG